MTGESALGDNLQTLAAVPYVKHAYVTDYCTCVVSAQECRASDRPIPVCHACAPRLLTMSMELTIATSTVHARHLTNKSCSTFKNWQLFVLYVACGWATFLLDVDSSRVLRHCHSRFIVYVTS